MRIVIAAVGRAKEPAYRSLLDEYYGRTRHWAEVVENEIREDRDDKVATALARVFAVQGSRAEVIAMEVTGERLSSEQFARRIDSAMQRAVTPVFVIGGADGNVPLVKSAARWSLSLGPMTLPHRLARLVLAEQVYRAFTILRGEPYAR